MACCWSSCTARSAGSRGRRRRPAGCCAGPGTGPGWARSIPHAFRHGFATAVLDASGGNLRVRPGCGRLGFGHRGRRDLRPRRCPRSGVRRGAAHGCGASSGEGRSRCWRCTGSEHGARAGRDRLELLTALIEGPGFDPLFRGDVIAIPPRASGLRLGVPWSAGCERPAQGQRRLCLEHRASVARGAAGGQRPGRVPRRAPAAGPAVCVEPRRCAGSARPAARRTRRAAVRTATTAAGVYAPASRGAAGAAGVAGRAGPAPTATASCQVEVCPDLAASRWACATGHESALSPQGRPGGARRCPRGPAVRAGGRRSRSARDEAEFRAGARRPPPAAGPGRSTCAGWAADQGGDPVGPARPRPGQEASSPDGAYQRVAGLVGPAVPAAPGR